MYCQGQDEEPVPAGGTAWGAQTQDDAHQEVRTGPQVSRLLV